MAPGRGAKITEKLRTGGYRSNTAQRFTADYLTTDNL